jgi:hypothetical protein
LDILRQDCCFEILAQQEHRENRTVLFPIRIDNSIEAATAPWAADLRRKRHIGDISSWKQHDAYQKALARLVRDLRPSEASAAPAS